MPADAQREKKAPRNYPKAQIRQGADRVSARPAEHVARRGFAALLATNSESAMRGLDFDIALTLCTGRESKRTLRSINDDAASALVWVVDKLVKTYS
jgi:hypothetical protein